MSAERYRQVVELFDAAVLLPETQRDAFLREECVDDAALLEGVRRLLEHDRRALPLTGLASWRRALDELTDDAASPPSIEGYRILRHLGSGGMGDVYEAEQASPRRRVALKVIRRGLVSRSAVRRFEREAAVLGRLDHPGIAKVHEAGMADDGFGATPYFVMELVEAGVDLLAHADAGDLPLRRRLALMVDVCAAVAHGHEHGVVHGDLKPANILVDRAGQTRVIDFGVARVTDADLTLTTIDAPSGQVFGTLQYASPEQCTRRSDDIDARSDVYALGLVLYELVCGRRPYEVDGGTITAAIHTICRSRPTPPRVDDHALGVDLGAVILRAIAKDRRTRYRSAGELGDELSRILADEPVLARPPTAFETLRRLARSNRSAVWSALATVTVLACAAAVLVGLWLGTRQALLRVRSADQRAAIVAADLWRTVTAADETVGEDPEFRAAFDLADAALAAGSAGERAAGLMRALQEWERAEARRRSGVSALLRRAEAAVGEGDFAAAEHLLERAGSHGDVAERWRQLYLAWIDAVETRPTRDEAREVADRASAAFPEDEAMTRAAARVRLLFLDLVRIEPGVLVAGSEPGAEPIPAALPRRTVRIDRPFLLGRTEVTQGQFAAVMGRNESFWPGDLDRPVERITWCDALAFCNELSRREGLHPRYAITPTRIDDLTGSFLDADVRFLEADGYRLPTDAEWEHACRAGTRTTYSFGDSTSPERAGEFMWYAVNSDAMTHPVASKLPNPWGLHDMHGGVWEWCEDVWHADCDGAPTTASPWLDGGDPQRRVIRGGSYHDVVEEARSAFRDQAPTGGHQYINVGFRVARSPAR